MEQILYIPPENTINLCNIGTNNENFQPIPFNGFDYTILTKSNYGFIELMRSKYNNAVYAIKKIPLKEWKNNRLKNEILNLTTLNNDYALSNNLIKLYGYFQSRESIIKLKEIYKETNLYKDIMEDQVMVFLVFDYKNDAILKKYYNLNRPPNNPIKESIIIGILKQISFSLKHIHKNGIILGNINLDNILFDNFSNIKLSDFSCAINCRNNKNNQNNVLPQPNILAEGIDFIAPEILKKEKYDYKADIYSVGLIMLCLISKINPITVNNLERDIYPYEVDDIYDKYLVKLIQTMISENPIFRPNASDVFDELCMIEKCQNQNLNRNRNENIGINNMQNNNSNGSFNINNQKYQNNSNEKNFNFNGNQNFLQSNNPNLNNFNMIPNLNPIHSMSNINLIQNNSFQPMFGQMNLNLSKNPSQPFPINNNINIRNLMPNGNGQGPRSENIGLKNIKNTSLISVMKCLYHCMKNIAENMANKNIQGNNPNNILIKYIFTVMTNTGNDNNDCTFIYHYIQKFREELRNYSQIFSGNEEIYPYIIFENIFSLLNNELKKNYFYFNNNTFVPPGLTQFPNIYQSLQNFEKEKSPISDLFYFSRLELITCFKCNYTFDAQLYNETYLKFDASLGGSISNLIKNYFSIRITNKYICKKCQTNSNEKNYFSFLIYPKYLVICFEGKTMYPKNLESEIDLSDYNYLKQDINIIPYKYTLISFISKDNNKFYNTYIKKGTEWYYYEYNKINYHGQEKFEQTFPYLVFYKREE